MAKEIGSLARPDDIRFTQALPKTRSGKIMRRLLRELATSGEIKGDTTTLEDFTVIAQLRGIGRIDKHFQDESVELQIPPLRCAPVEMTNLRVALSVGIGLWMKNRRSRQGFARDDKGKGGPFMDWSLDGIRFSSRSVR